MEFEIGRVAHYYNHLHVAVIRVNEALKLGDKIRILGHKTDFEQRIGSMEVEHHQVVWVKPGENVAIQVDEPVHEHDVVYRVVEGMPEPALG